MKGIGRGMREFNDAKGNVKNEIEEGMREKDKQATAPPPAVTPVTPVERTTTDN